MDILDTKKFIIELFIKYIKRPPNYNEIYTHLKHFESVYKQEKINFEERFKESDEYSEHKKKSIPSCKVDEIIKKEDFVQMQFDIINNIKNKKKIMNTNVIFNMNKYKILNEKYFNSTLQTEKIIDHHKLSPINIFTIRSSA